MGFFLAEGLIKGYKDKKSGEALGSHQNGWSMMRKEDGSGL